MPSGRKTAIRSKRGNSSTRGRSKGRRIDETTSVDSPTTIADLGIPASMEYSLSQPARSNPRSGGSRNAKPYENSEQAQELKLSNDIVWELARGWFVPKLWRESCFFIKPDEEHPTVDRCAIEAYEAAISEFCDLYPDRAPLITKYRLQPQSRGALVKCRQVVSGSYSKFDDSSWF